MGLLFKRALGVEIDDLEIKAVELRERNGRICICGYDRISLPPDIVKDGIISKPTEVSSYIKELWTMNGFKKNNIILGLSNQDVMIRKILLPDLPKEKLDLLIPNHAQEYMPFSLEDSLVDYMVVGKREVQGVKNVEILLAAAKLPMVEDFYYCFDRLGLKIKDIKVSSLSLLNVIDQKDSDGVAILVDISNNLGNLVVYMDGYPRLARMLRVNLAQSTGLEPAKISTKMELLEIVLSTWAQILYNEIRTSIQYFQVQEDVGEINKIMLSGCGSRIMGLDIELQNNLGVPVESINPMQRIRTAKKYPFDAQLIDFTTCIGLALAGLEGKEN